MNNPGSGGSDGEYRVMGVDACKKGWVGITNDARGYFGSNIESLIRSALEDGALHVIAIDIPIGLPETGPRQADALARKLVGRRASSVFSTPIRAALAASTHAEATAISAKTTGKGLSQQAFGLGKKILEVDQWARTTSQRVIEVHPEVCFASMGGGHLRHPKSTWAGSEERRGLLASAGITVPGDIGIAGEMAGTDDVLDAAAAVWTALRFAKGVAISHPLAPERFGDGHDAAIWA
ncbi:DUF429 domain-containing protein [Intrasporangium calvum]|nr:DUF429 domain-containing protein [Intrasporangium calvum]